MVWFMLILAVVISVAWITIFVYLQCFHSPADRKEDPYTLIPGKQYEELAEIILECTRIMDKTPCEHLYMTSSDGLRLHARYYHTQDDAPTVIVFHGYKGNALRDGAGGFALCRRLGFNVLVPDQRAHAKSDGKVITFGAKERFDCLDWIQFVNERNGAKPVLLSGLSMGAATVLMTADLPLPENVVGIMADCPYASPAGIIRKVCTQRGFPQWLVFPFVRLAAKIIGRFSVMQASAVMAVRSAKIPILLIHGGDDRFVPCEMSQEIAENCGSAVTLEVFPGAGHGLCYMTDPERYEAVALDFMGSIPELAKYLAEGKL